MKNNLDNGLAEVKGELKKQTFISVIIPNYNHEKFLPQRINTVLNQTYQNFEVIILDDCSTDNSIELIKQYQNYNKISHIIINSVNSGSPFKQWQKGIALANGEYIWIAESDDWAEPTFLERTVAVLDANKEVSSVYTQSYISDEDSNIIRTNYSWTDDLNVERWRKNFINDGRDECLNYLFHKNTIPNASAVLFRKEAISFVTVWPVKMKMLGDWLFWIQIISSNKIAYISDCLNYFRQTSHSTRNHFSFLKRRKRLIEELYVLYYNCKINNLPKPAVSNKYDKLVRSILNLCISNRRYFAFLAFLLNPINFKIKLTLRQ